MANASKATVVISVSDDAPIEEWLDAQCKDLDRTDKYMSCWIEYHLDVTNVEHKEAFAAQLFAETVVLSPTIGVELIQSSTWAK